MSLTQHPSFSQMISPLSTSEFLHDYYGKKPLLLQRQNPRFYGELLTPQKLDDILFHWPNAASVVNADKNGGHRKNLNSSLTQAQTASVINALDEGDSLIFDQLDQRVPSLARLNGALEAELHCPVQSNIYITPPNAKGFRPHVDDHHVFILQTQGSKRWRVNNQQHTPVIEAITSSQQAIDEDDHQAFTLHQGDLIYIPPFTTHEALSQDQYSVHITLSPHPVKLRHSIQQLLSHASLQTALEQTLPLGYLTQPESRLKAHLKSQLLDVIESIDDQQIRDFIEAQKGRLRGYYTGAVAQRIARPPLQLPANFVVNHSLFRHQERTETELQVHLPHKVASFPIEFADAISFCLNTTHFCSDDIPAADDTEKPILLTRLLTEGLIQRACK